MLMRLIMPVGIRLLSKTLVGASGTWRWPSISTSVRVEPRLRRLRLALEAFWAPVELADGPLVALKAGMPRTISKTLPAALLAICSLLRAVTGVGATKLPLVISEPVTLTVSASSCATTTGWAQTAEANIARDDAVARKTLPRKPVRNIFL